MINKIEKLKKEIRNMYGCEIGYGYFRHVEEKPGLLEIDICDVLDALAPYEIDEYVDEDYDIDDYLYEECEEIRSDNTYNWHSPISNHINYEIFRNNDLDYIVRVMIHMNCSDIRCGYSEYMYFKFGHEEEFFEVIMEDTNKYIPIGITKDEKDLEYEVAVEVFSEGVQVLDEYGMDLSWDNAQEVLEMAFKQNAFDGYNK